MYKISTPIWDAGYRISEDVWRHRYKLWGKKGDGKQNWQEKGREKREKEDLRTILEPSICSDIISEELGSTRYDYSLTRPG